MNFFKPLILTTALITFSASCFSQDSGFPFGKNTYAELDMKSYPADTTAGAVVLKEFGEAHINSEDGKLVFQFHTRIKILKRAGFSQATFTIPLYKGDEGREEKWLSLEASTFNREGNSIKESKLEKSAFFNEKTSKNYNLVKFTLPDIRVGSIVEVKYSTTSPFIFNFHGWEFQDDIPKVSSEYWARIPGNYLYNIALRGYLALTSNESSIDKDCFVISSQRKADCVLNQYRMEKIPAFVEEEYMTAKKNFVSSINFELSEIKRFDGTTDKITKTWKDVDEELRQHESFGTQIRKARNIGDDQLKLQVAPETDPLKKAKIIYQYIGNWYTWNGEGGMYSDTEVKKAYDLKKGNVGDINLTLIGVLQSYDLDAAPVMLSTRSNGLPIELYPVMSGFNYVIARVKIGGKDYLLDATDSFLPFGSLPIRCFNGRGRVIGTKVSDWIDLKPTEKKKRTINFNLALRNDGTLQGKLTIQSIGYAGADARKEIARAQGQGDYIKQLQSKWTSAAITNYTNENLDNPEKPLTEKMDITFTGFDNPEAGTLYFDPFLAGRLSNNPFKSAERLYPVDMGVAEETTLILSLEIPETLRVDDAPANTGLQLPAGGGKFLISSSSFGNKISLTTVFALNRAVYSSEEYHYLKEFYARVIQAQQSQFVLKRK